MAQLKRDLYPAGYKSLFFRIKKAVDDDESNVSFLNVNTDKKDTLTSS